MYGAEAIKTGVRTGLLNTMVAMPAIIQSFDATNQTVKAQIAIMRIVDGKNKPHTLLIDIPIIIPTVKGFHITMPINPDDECLLIFADRCIDDWFSYGGVQAQAEHRIHHISDGFALIGVNSEPNAITDYSTDSMVIRNTANNQKIALRPGGDVDIETTANVNITCVEAVVKASSSVTLDTPSTQITGKLDVVGPITSKASVTAPTIKGTLDVLAANISGKTHKHDPITGTPI